MSYNYVMPTQKRSDVGSKKSQWVHTDVILIYNIECNNG